jgi:hypothetical protein
VSAPYNQGQRPPGYAPQHAQGAYAAPPAYPQSPPTYPQSPPGGQYPPAPQSPPGGQYPPGPQSPAGGQYPPGAQSPAGPPGYGSAPPRGYPAPQSQPPVAQTQCRFCGNVPAAKVTFRGHRGMVFLMQFLHVEGPFCRDCGLATFRAMSAKTLVQGWWGYASSIITPVTLLINVARRGKVASLEPPRPPAHGPSGRPMDPGGPLFTRTGALIGLFIPIVLIMLLVFLIAYQAVTTV